MAPDWKNTPIRLPGEHEILPDPIVVQSGMLDTNRHMNNAWYAHVAAELLPEDFGCTRLSIEYKKPAALGDRLFAARAIGEGDAIVALNDAQGSPYALVRFMR